MAKLIMLALLALMVALSFAEIPTGPLHDVIRGTNTINGTNVSPYATPKVTASITGSADTNPPFTNISTSHHRSITKTIIGSNSRSITKTINGPVAPNATITQAPTTLKTVLEKKAPAANGCHLSTLYGGQDVVVIEVCDPYTTICQECVGCNAPVVVCSTY